MNRSDRSRLREILSSGIAPGFAGIARDPGCPQVAIPRALRQMEDKYGARAGEMIGKGSQFSTKRLREIWINGRKKRKHIPKPE